MIRFFRTKNEISGAHVWVWLIVGILLLLGRQSAQCQHVVCHLQYAAAPWSEGYSDRVNFTGPVQAGNVIPAGVYEIYNGEGIPTGVLIDTNVDAPAGTVFYDMGTYDGNASFGATYSELPRYPGGEFPDGGDPYGQPLVSNRLGWTLNNYYTHETVGNADGGAVITGTCEVGGNPVTFNFPTSYTVYYSPSNFRLPEPPSPHPGSPLVTSADQAAPVQHRKVALNGRPLPDGKPQTTPETDAAPEESFIDAFTLGLHHDTTDIYIAVASTDLALQVRRSAVPEVWSEREGLLPGEMPDRPFGSAWTSNLGATIHFVRHNPLYPVSINLDADYAYVTDEDGSTYRFVVVKDPNDSSGQEKYVPLPGARNQQETYLNSLVGDGPGGWTFQRKYGTRLTFADAGINLQISGNRLALGSFVQEIHSYARLTQIIDRTGASLTYTYSSTGTIIPLQIGVTGHSEQCLLIQSDSQGRTVQSVTDPLNHVWNYTYQVQSYTDPSLPSPSSCSKLTSVQAPMNPGASVSATTTYGYSAAIINDTLPGSLFDPHLPCDVSSIQNPLGKTYNFTYQANQSSKASMGSLGFYPVPGLPRVISEVDLPDNLGTSYFTNSSFVATIPDGSTGLAFYGHKVNYGIDAAGNGRLYQFTDPSVNALTSFKPFLPNREILDPFHVPRIVLFGSETIVSLSGQNITFNEDTSHENTFSYTLGGGTSEAGRESFTFDLSAGMAPASATDMSGNKTTFTYADTWDFTANYPFLTGTSYAFGKYADPTQQTDALTQVKSFTYYPAPSSAGAYDPRARRMTKIIDEAGHKTVYNLDTYGNRLNEQIYETNSGPLTRYSEFVYGDSRFPGFITKRIVHATGTVPDPAWAVDLVTSYAADTLGRVQTETAAANSLKLVTAYTYDTNNNKKTVQEPRGPTTTFNYDYQNHLIEVIYPDTAASPGINHKKFTYDLAGQKLTETDERGNMTFFDYDALGRLVRIVRDMDASSTETAGDLVSYNVVFDAVGNKISETDPNGNQTLYTYDALGRLLTRTDPAPYNYVTTYSYDPPSGAAAANAGGSIFDSSSFHPTTIVGRRGFTTSFYYDKLYRLTTRQTQYSQAPNPVAYAMTAYGYDAVGNQTSETDDLGNVTKRSYDALNRVTLTTLAWSTGDQATRSTLFTHTGLLWKSTDENGNTTETQSDAAGRPQYILQPLVDDGTGTHTQHQPTTQNVYDAGGNLAAFIDPRGKQWDYTYDERNRRTQELGPFVIDAEHSPSGPAVRPETDFAYDKAGNPVSRLDPRHYTTTFVFDSANRQIETDSPSIPVLQPDGNTLLAQHPVTHTAYFANGAVQSVTDANGNTTANLLDTLNRLYRTTDALGHYVTYGYDADGNSSRVKDGNQQATNYTYDGLNRLVSVQDAVNPTTKFTYNGVNKTKRTDSLGKSTLYTYDHRNRLTYVNYSGRAADNRTYTLDAASNILSVALLGRSDHFCDVSYTYDALNRVSSETSNQALNSYTYDLGGNPLTATHGYIGGAAGRVSTSTFDDLGRLGTIKDGTNTYTYHYDLNGDVQGKDFPSGETEVSTYDSMGHRLSNKDTTGSGSLLYSYTFAADLAGNVRRMYEYKPGLGVVTRTTLMKYDVVNRLAEELVYNGSNNSAPLAIDTVYGYDGADNRTSKNIAGGVATTYTYNSLNQLTGFGESPGGRQVGFGYDADGNRTSRTEGSATDTYAYDLENRLVSLDKGGVHYAYAYDYRTRRVQRNEGSTSTWVVYSGGSSVQEYAGSTTSSPAAEFIRGSDWGGGVGGILFSVRGGTLNNYHYDGRGDVGTRTNATGTITYQGAYESWGTRRQEYGSDTDRQRANTKEEDPTGLLDEGLRYRDLETGSFITRDPAGLIDGPNLYTFVRQNPWTKFDPEGLAQEVIGQIYTAVNHESKELYVGQVNGPKVMADGGTVERHKASDHPARGLLDKEGTIRTYDDVVVEDKWKQVAKENGIPENSARANTVKSMERAQLEAAMEKYPDYKVINKIGEEGDLGRGIIGAEKAGKYTEIFEPKMAEKPRTDVNVGGKWTSSKNVQIKPGQRTAYGLAIGLAFMVAGEMTGANQAAANEIHEQLQQYQRNPNPATGAYLGILVGNAFGAPDTVTLMLQQSFMEHAENSR